MIRHRDGNSSANRSSSLELTSNFTSDSSAIDFAPHGNSPGYEAPALSSPSAPLLNLVSETSFSKKLPCRWQFCNSWVLYAIGALVVLAGYYEYLNQLYLLDEVLEGTMLRELQPQERFTIRTELTNARDFGSLQGFISHYAICPSVFEIEVLWSAKNGAPPLDPEDAFVFPKTHSKVTLTKVPESSASTELFKSDASTQGI